MEEENKTAAETTIPDYQGPVEELAPVAETGTSAKETVSETVTETAEEVKQENSSDELLRLENETYQRHFAEMTEEIENLRKRFNVPPDKKPDPMDVLTGEVNELKSGFSEIKNMLSEQANNQRMNQAQQMPMFQPQQNPMFPQMGGYGFQPMYPQPMVQTSAILPAPTLPYFQTPNFIPMNTQLPHVNTDVRGGQNTEANAKARR